MNVLQILPQLRVGGVETGTVDLAKMLVKHNHKAVVISAGGPLVDSLISVGAKHYCFPVHKKNPFLIFLLIKKVAEIIKKEKIDVVHARSRVPAFIGYFAAGRCGVPFITTCHGYYGKHLLSKIMGMGKFVICVSRCIAEHMKKNFNVPQENIVLIHRAVDLSRYHFKERINTSSPYTIGIVGRITPLKGHDTFFKAMSNVVRMFPYVKIVVAGQAPKSKQDYFNKLVKLTEQLKIDKHVEFLGNVKDVPALMQTLDVLVLSTRTPEGFGRVLIEAGASGVPVVATKVGGVVDIVQHNVSGILVEPEQPTQLSQAVLTLLQNRAFAQELVNNARKKVEKDFALETLYNKTVNVYKEAVAKKRILVIKISAIGDIILITPSLRALREKYKDSYIAILVGKKAAPLISRCPYIDEVILYPTESTGIAKYINLIKLAGFIRNRSFDLSIDFQNNFRTQLLSYISMIPLRLGHNKRKASFLLNRKPVTQTTQIVNPILHQYRLLSLLDIYPDNEYLELWPSKQDYKKAEELLKAEWVSNNTRIIGISLSSSTRWLTKRWPLMNYIKFAELASKKFNARIVVVGSNEDEKIAEFFVSRVKAKVISACGETTLTQLAALIKKCDVFISSDSAPMHIAAAMQVPFIGLFGPTDPRRHVCQDSTHKILYKRQKCSPCYKDKCSDIKCMEAISVDDVMDAVAELIEK